MSLYQHEIQLPKTDNYQFQEASMDAQGPQDLPGSDTHPKDPPELPNGPPAQCTVRDLQLLIPPHFCHMSLLIFNISHHETWMKFKEITTVAPGLC